MKCRMIIMAMMVMSMFLSSADVNAQRNDRGRKGNRTELRKDNRKGFGNDLRRNDRNNDMRRNNYRPQPMYHGGKTVVHVHHNPPRPIHCAPPRHVHHSNGGEVVAGVVAGTVLGCIIGALAN